MSLYAKDGVRIRGICPELVLGLMVVRDVFTEYEAACIITSCVDGRHSETSLHPAGRAVDLRSKHLGDDKISLRNACKARLGSFGDFDFILEGLNTPNEHFHMEYQPKTSAGVL